MPAIITPATVDVEHVMTVPVARSDKQCRVVSGSVILDEKDFLNVHGDQDWVYYDVHLVVGPHWLDVQDCSPVLGIDGFSLPDHESADSSGTEILRCTWDTVGQVGVERIRLKASLRMRGGQWFSTLKLGYHLIAVGR
jgi:hypothetical protein